MHRLTARILGAVVLLLGVVGLFITPVLLPALVGAGICINLTKVYLPELVVWWCFLVIAMGTLSLVHADSHLSLPLAFSALVTLGVGIIYAGMYFPVLAPLNVRDNAYALSFFAYCRQFAAVSLRDHLAPHTACRSYR